MGKFAQGCGQTVCVAELEPGSEAAALAPPPRRLRSVGSAGGAVSASLLAPADGKGAAQGGRWTFRINYGGGGGSGVSLVAPSDGKGAAEGGQQTSLFNFIVEIPRGTVSDPACEAGCAR